MNTLETKTEQLLNGIEEMEAAVERLRSEIHRLQQERDALEQGNLELFRKLTTVCFCHWEQLPINPETTDDRQSHSPRTRRCKTIPIFGFKVVTLP